MRRGEAPWTAEEVDYLVAWQASNEVHPYTCPMDDLDLDAHESTNVGNETKLVPTRLGMRCPGCNFTQRWAHFP